MSYPKQSSTLSRLWAESLRDLDLWRERGNAHLIRQWEQARRELKFAIYSAYRRVAPASERWNIVALRGSGEYQRLAAEVTGILERFRAVSVTLAGQARRSIKRRAILRHAWALDQVTPNGFTPNIPSWAFRESFREDAVGFSERWSAWLDAYRTALMSNLALGAINESSIDDATDEVDATRAGSPAYAIDSALKRLWEYEAVAAVSDGAEEFNDANQDLLEVEVWKTRGEFRVCDDCDANEGLSMDEADGDIPMHPHCHCYWLLVPKSYADLLKSGDDDDKALARQMLARGIVPNALVIRNEDGEIAAKAIVKFGAWLEGVPAISGGVR